VDPPVADLVQAPYSRIPRQGVCDLSQGPRVGDRGETVAFLGEGYPGHLRLAGDVLVAVEDDLRGERRMPGHLDRHVPPDRVRDVKRVVVDVVGLLDDVDDHIVGSAAADLPHRRRRLRDQDQEHSRPDHGVGGQVLLDDAVLTFAALAVDDRNAVGIGPGPHPAGEPARQAHQVALSRFSSESSCHRHHHTRNPPGPCPIGSRR
jgi:hypothetical protein